MSDLHWLHPACLVCLQVRLHLIDKRGVLAENGTVINAPAKPYNISVVFKVSSSSCDDILLFPTPGRAKRTSLWKLQPVSTTSQ
jgi:hypothetical protein